MKDFEIKLFLLLFLLTYIKNIYFGKLRLGTLAITQIYFYLPGLLFKGVTNCGLNLIKKGNISEGDFIVGVSCFIDYSLCFVGSFRSFF